MTDHSATAISSSDKDSTRELAFWAAFFSAEIFINALSLYPLMMSLSKEEKSVLKILVEKELHHVKKDDQGFIISNAPFLGKSDDPDLPFLKSLKLYKSFLEQLKLKL